MKHAERYLEAKLTVQVAVNTCMKETQEAYRLMLRHHDATMDAYNLCRAKMLDYENELKK